MNSYIPLTLALFGVVDQIHGKNALVEITTGEETNHILIPLSSIPCQVSEGDLLELTQKDQKSKAEIRCVDQ